MKGKYIILLKLLIASELLFAQNSAYQWAKQIGTEYGGNDQANCIKTDASNNIYVAGSFEGLLDMDPSAGTYNITSARNKDPFFAKYDANGSLIWAKSISGGSNDDIAFSITVDGSGNVYVSGYFSGTADFDPALNTAVNRTAAGLGDMFIAKYDINGNYIWAITVGSSYSGDMDIAQSIIIDNNNDILVAGQFTGTTDFDPGAGTANLTTSASHSAFIAKYSNTGNYIWARGLVGGQSSAVETIILDGTSNIIVSGVFRGTVDFDPGASTANLTSVTCCSDDTYFAKFDPSGNYTWVKHLPTRQGSGSTIIGNSIALDGSDNILITGAFALTVDFDPGAGTANLTSVTNFNDIFFAKYSSSGAYIWAKSIGGSDHDDGLSIISDASDNVFIAGYFLGTADFDPSAGTANLVSAGAEDIFMAKYDASGNYLWANRFGSTGSDKANTLAKDGGGNIISAGYFNQTVDFDPGAGIANQTATYSNSSFFTGKYNSAGNYIWAFAPFETLGYEYPYCITNDTEGNLYVTGQFYGTIDFDPSPATNELSSLSDYNCFLAKYDKNGNYAWAKLISSTSANRGISVKIENNGNIILAGIFSGTTDFDPSPGIANITSAGSSDIFIAKYDNNGNYLWAKAFGGVSDELFYSISIDAGNNILIGGHFFGTCDFDPSPAVANLTSSGPDDIFFAKYDPSGNYLWAKNIGKSTGGIYEERILALCNDGTGNLYIAGHFLGTVDFDPGAGVANMVSAGSNDIFFAKYDPSGNYLWAKRAGSTGDDFAWGIKIDMTGNLILSGNYFGTVDFDPGAGTANLVSAGSNDIFLAKYDANGNYLFAKSTGGSGYESMNTLIIDGTNNYYISGTFQGTADFDPSAATANLTSAGGSDLFIAKYDINGNYSYAINMGGTLNEQTYWGGLSADPNGNIYSGSIFQSIVDFDPSAGVANLITTYIGSDMAIAKYGCTTISLASSNQTITQNIVTNLFYNSNSCNNLIAKLFPSGASPATGSVTAKVWIEGAVPTYAGKPFVARHYEITPATNASTATGRVTLYFTQQEFTDFNNHAGSILDLPAGPADAGGKANLRIGKYSGTSSNGSGLPGTYTAGAMVIDPNDADIVWNSSLSRWEISFDVTGFSGFIVQTSTAVLPVHLLSFTGKLQTDNKALLEWKVEEQSGISEYVVEKSNDGLIYNPIGSVAANNFNSFTYSFPDPQQVTGNQFYRLKIVEQTKTEYSQTIRLSNLEGNNTEIYPIPASEFIIVQSSETKLLNSTARITDMSGRVLKQFTLTSLPMRIYISDLSKGIYMLQVQDGSTFKIIKE